MSSQSQWISADGRKVSKYSFKVWLLSKFSISSCCILIFCRSKCNQIIVSKVKVCRRIWELNVSQLSMVPNLPIVFRGGLSFKNPPMKILYPNLQPILKKHITSIPLVQSQFFFQQIFNFIWETFLWDLVTIL